MSTSRCLLFAVLFAILDGKFAALDDDDDWPGRWFPDDPCDGGDSDLDWDGSPEAYECFETRRLYAPDYSVRPVVACQHLPASYEAASYCVNRSLDYPDQIPTYGSHRPLWAKYGEYRYLPPQRWLHNLERGALVALYHPCAQPSQVAELKRLVEGCLYRHIVTPYPLLSPERPLALVTWGCRLTMSAVDPDTVRSFVKDFALRGPKPSAPDGRFQKELLVPARVVSDDRDRVLCPTQTGM